MRFETYPFYKRPPQLTPLFADIRFAPHAGGREPLSLFSLYKQTQIPRTTIPLKVSFDTRDMWLKQKPSSAI